MLTQNLRLPRAARSKAEDVSQFPTHLDFEPVRRLVELDTLHQAADERARLSTVLGL